MPYAIKDVRVHLVMSPDEIAALDGWCAAYNVRSRSEAIRQAVAQMLERTPAKKPKATRRKAARDQ